MTPEETIAAANAHPAPLRWRLWWRFGFGPVIRLVKLLPIAEWRQEHWIWRIDIWAMNHIGRRRFQ